MRELIVQEYLSLDGFAAEEGGERQGTGFFFDKPEYDAGMEADNLAFFDRVDTMLLGAATYRMFVDYWPTATTDEQPIAGALNALSKYVASTTLDAAPWGEWPAARVLGDDAIAAVESLKRAPGKGIVVWGSLRLAAALAGAGLVDEYDLRVCPLALGRGRALFPEAGAALALVESRTYPSGVVRMRYRPARA